VWLIFGAGPTSAPIVNAGNHRRWPPVDDGTASLRSVCSAGVPDELITADSLMLFYGYDTRLDLDWVRNQYLDWVRNQYLAL